MDSVSANNVRMEGAACKFDNLERTVWVNHNFLLTLIVYIAIILILLVIIAMVIINSIKHAK